MNLWNAEQDPSPLGNNVTPNSKKRFYEICKYVRIISLPHQNGAAKGPFVNINFSLGIDKSSHA